MGEVALLGVADVAEDGARGGGGPRAGPRSRRPTRLATPKWASRSRRASRGSKAAGLEGRARDRGFGLGGIGEAGGQLGALARPGSRGARRRRDLVPQALEAAGARPTRPRRTRRWWARGPPCPTRRRARVEGQDERGLARPRGRRPRAGCPGVMTRTTSRLTTPLAARGSSICSQRATRKPCLTRRAM